MQIVLLNCIIEKVKFKLQTKTRPAWAGFKTAEEGRANTPFRVGKPCGPRGKVNPQK
jgi:hypothetical protein